ncbi:MAG: hypothetical protein PWP23_2295 [Candidatus Sumerlaeota bacterium]|nr:hypothetical protein [Candidatus Sumerlaeota bacterium]
MRNCYRLRGTAVAGALFLTASAFATITNTTQSTTHATLTDAITAAVAGDTIEVDGDVLAERVVVNKADLTINGINGATIDTPATAATNSTCANVRILSTGCTIDGFIINVEAPNNMAGIVVSQASAVPANSITSVTITNNTINYLGSGKPAGYTHGNLVPFVQATTDNTASGIVLFGNNNATIDATVTGNVVGADGAEFPHAGIWAERQVGGTIANNTVHTEHFQFIARFIAQTTLTVDNNQFLGWGDERNRGAQAEIGDIGANGVVKFINNTITAKAGYGSQTDDHAPGEVGTTIRHRRGLQIKNIYSSFSIFVDGNTVNARNTGIAITNARDITLRNNTVNALEDDTVLIEVNNKIYSSANSYQSDQPYQWDASDVASASQAQNSPAIFGSTLNDGGFSGVKGVVFLNHNGEDADNSAGGPITFYRVALGGPGALANKFSAGLDTFIELDNAAAVPTSTLARYENGTTESDVASSTAGPFTKSIYAADNLFDVGSGLVLPSTMSVADAAILDGKISDGFDNAGSTGYVITGSVSETDADNDGLPVPVDPNDSSANSDSDIFTDLQEFKFESPMTADDTDVDNDKLPDLVDSNKVGANPKDSDSDSYADFYEVLLGYNPNDANSKPELGDVDGDGDVDLADGLEMFKSFLGLPNGVTRPDNFDVNIDGSNDNVDGVIAVNFYLGNITIIPLVQ